MKGTQLPSDCAGAFVNVFLCSPNMVEAIKLVEAELLQDCYKPVNTYAAFELNLNDTDYDTDEEGYPDNEDLMNLHRNGGIWYGPFHCYPPEKHQVQ
ncbi:hypothetical protein [Sessilibacter corallicola]|uniref:Uncharacterized protein n=1 Tax=Sessilibacter corallicola TaxID=2904075 RepID=A0ABQ0AF85_9GAMM